MREAILAHARAALPDECCGLLVGTAARISRAWPARNAAEQPDTHYRIDPADHFAALRQARTEGADVVGAYHSHPRSAAQPSERDVAEAFPDFIHVLVGPVAEAAEVRAWRLVGGNFMEIRLVPE